MSIKKDETSTMENALNKTKLDGLLHDLKQPLNLIRVMAQEIKLDIAKDRLELQTLPENMKHIMEAVDETVNRIERLRASLTNTKPDE